MSQETVAPSEFYVPVYLAYADMSTAGGAAATAWLWETQVDLDTREATSCWLRENVLWNSDSGTLVAGR